MKVKCQDCLLCNISKICSTSRNHTVSVPFNSLAKSLSCCWQISVDADVAFHQHCQLVQQWDNIPAAAAEKEAEASVGIHQLKQYLPGQTVQ